MLDVVQNILGQPYSGQRMGGVAAQHTFLTYRLLLSAAALIANKDKLLAHFPRLHIDCCTQQVSSCFESCQGWDICRSRLCIVLDSIMTWKYVLTVPST